MARNSRTDRDERAATGRVLDELGKERDKQRRHWGNSHDDKHTLGEWLSLVQLRLDTIDTGDHAAGHGHIDRELWVQIADRELWVQIAALAVAAIEEGDRVMATSARESHQHVWGPIHEALSRAGTPLDWFYRRCITCGVRQRVVVVVDEALEYLTREVIA